MSFTVFVGRVQHFVHDPIDLIVLTEIQVGSDARDRLQPSEIFMRLFALTGERAGEAIYGQDNHLGFCQAVCFA